MNNDKYENQELDFSGCGGCLGAVCVIIIISVITIVYFLTH